MLKKIKLFTAMLLLIAGGGTTITAIAEDKAAEVEKAIQSAEVELNAAAEAGHVWRMIDPATGGGSVSIRQLLTIAQEKHKAGELDEALRLATKVAAVAKLGQEQAANASSAAPFYVR